MTYLQDDPPLPSLPTLFPYLEQEPNQLSDHVDPFTVTTASGFLPLKPPLKDLPSDFDALTQILDEMPIRKHDGQPGLLAKYQLGPRIDGGDLPDLTAKVEALVQNLAVINLSLVTALFRDYSFVASSYLLEPCWENWSKDHTAGYGLGRDKLPRCIAGPLSLTAKVWVE